MDANGVLDLIKKRSAELRERSNWRSAAHMVEAAQWDFLMAEEYDALIGQIEGAMKSSG
jgi:hypothetical protein